MYNYCIRSLIFAICLTFGIISGSLSFRVAEDTKPAEGTPQPLPEHHDFFARVRTEEFSSPEPSPAPLDPSEVRKTFCTDPAIRPIWKLIRRNKDVREALDHVWSRYDDPDCRSMFELKYVDLDRDGRAEILVRGGRVALCGAVGNCDFWVIKQERKGLRLLLHGNDYIDATDMGKQVLKTRTNGYADLLLKGHSSVSETSYSTYKYDGRRYVERRCRYELPNYEDPNYNSEKPTWHFISCREFLKDQSS